jgi:hypothetical protein
MKISSGSSGFIHHPPPAFIAAGRRPGLFPDPQKDNGPLNAIHPQGVSLSRATHRGDSTEGIASIASGGEVTFSSMI